MCAVETDNTIHIYIYIHNMCVIHTYIRMCVMYMYKPNTLISKHLLSCYLLKPIKKVFDW